MPGAPPTPVADLASRWLGGSVMAASDESFGEKEHLLSPEPPAFKPGRYGPRGEVVDGWETRRRREAGHDWALIRLGAPGVISAVDIDTSFFTGNHPQAAAVEACGCEGYPSPAELAGPAAGWAEIVPRSVLNGDAHHEFEVTDPRRFTHVRLSIFPDGGVARLRVAGRVVPDPRPLEAVPGRGEAAAAQQQQRDHGEDGQPGHQEQPLLHPPVHPPAEDQQQGEQDVQHRAEQEHVPLHVDAEEVLLGQQAVRHADPAVTPGHGADRDQRRRRRGDQREPGVEADPEEDQPDALAPGQQPAEERVQGPADHGEITAIAAATVVFDLVTLLARQAA